LRGVGWGEFLIRAEVRRDDQTTLSLEHWLRLRAADQGATESAAATASGSVTAAGGAPEATGPSPVQAWVFLSYVITDIPFVRRLSRALEARGIGVRTENDLEPGLGWEPAISLLLRKVDAALFVVSGPPTSWLVRELEVARQLNLPILPILFGQAPDQLPESLFRQGMIVAVASAEETEQATDLLAEQVKALSRPPLVGDLRDRIARAIHDQYCDEQAGSKPPDDPAMRPWEDLSEDLRESNRQQADQIPEKLQRIGYTYGVAREQPAPQHEFTEQEVEVLAEMEHARWV
jgi:hypothetical protein